MASRDDDDDFDPSIIRKPTDGRKTLLLVLLAGAIGLGLIVCLAGVVIVAIFVSRDNSTAEKLPGSWKARWDIGGAQFDSIYTFKKDGTFREVAFDLQGRQMNISDGRWRFRNGEIEIDWNNGGFERAIATWVDDTTLTYRIVNHSQAIQIGLVTTFKRQ